MQDKLAVFSGLRFLWKQAKIHKRDKRCAYLMRERLYGRSYILVFTPDTGAITG